MKSLLSIHAPLGILSLLPLLGTYRSNWIQLLHFSLIVAGLIFLFLRHRSKATKSYGGYKVVVFLYFLFLLLRFYPTPYEACDNLIILALALIALFQLGKIFARIRAGDAPVSLEFADKVILFIITLIWLIMIASEGIFAENPDFDWVRTIGAAFIIAMLYLAISTNIDRFIARPFKLANSMPYGTLFVASAATVLGIASAINTLVLYERAQAHYNKKNMERSAELFVDFEHKNQHLGFSSKKKIYILISLCPFYQEILTGISIKFSSYWMPL